MANDEWRAQWIDAIIVYICMNDNSGISDLVDVNGHHLWLVNSTHQLDGSDNENENKIKYTNTKYNVFTSINATRRVRSARSLLKSISMRNTLITCYTCFTMRCSSPQFFAAVYSLEQLLTGDALYYNNPYDVHSCVQSGPQHRCSPIIWRTLPHGKNSTCSKISWYSHTHDTRRLFCC